MSTIIYHNHHIIPKHAGGTDHPDNIARLTTEEHAEAHRLLYEKYGRWQDKKAYEGLAGFKGKEQIIKECYSEGGKMSKGKPAWNKGVSMNVGKDNPMYGVEPWIKGRVMGPTPPERLKKISDALKGRVFSAEHRRKLSEAAKRRKKK
jgi:hypothetical protein